MAFTPHKTRDEKKSVTMMVRLGGDRLRLMERLADRYRLTKAELLRQMIDHCIKESEIKEKS